MRFYSVLFAVYLFLKVKLRTAAAILYYETVQLYSIIIIIRESFLRMKHRRIYISFGGADYKTIIHLRPTCGKLWCSFFSIDDLPGVVKPAMSSVRMRNASAEESILIASSNNVARGTSSNERDVVSSKYRRRNKFPGNSEETMKFFSADLFLRFALLSALCKRFPA